jgi:predicted small lipoprotein YifL
MARPELEAREAFGSSSFQRHRGGETGTRRWAMRRMLLVVTAVLLVLVLSFALAGCSKSSGNKGGGYLPAPRSSVPVAVA